MAMNSVTLQLPESSYKRAQRAAMLLNRSIEDFLESMLNSSLPVLDDAPSNDLAAEIAKLSTLSDADLWRVARSQMTATDEEQLHDLLDAQAERTLTEEEEAQLDALYHQVGRLTLIKSQAYALLHQRGHAVPQP
jgi:hypothetical protein